MILNYSDIAEKSDTAATATKGTAEALQPGGAGQNKDNKRGYNSSTTLFTTKW